MELRKILSQKFSDTFVKMFYDLNISQYIGLPRDGNVENFSKIYKNIFDKKPSQMTLLFALMRNQKDISDSVTALKLSNFEMYLLNALHKFVPDVQHLKNDHEILEFFNRELARSRSNIDRPLKKSEASEIAIYCNKAYLIKKISELRYPQFKITVNTEALKSVKFQEFETGETLSFADLVSQRRIRVNHLLSDLKEKWIDSNFALSEAQLVKSLEEKGLNSYVKLKKKK